MDYKQEKEKLTSSEYFKPEAGSYDVVFLGEMEQSSYTDENGNITPQVNINIEIDKKPYQWTISKGKTTGSLYGQLVEVAISNGNKLTGAYIRLMVKISGKTKNGYPKRDYFIADLTHSKPGK